MPIRARDVLLTNLTPKVGIEPHKPLRAMPVSPAVEAETAVSCHLLMCAWHSQKTTLFRHRSRLPKSHAGLLKKSAVRLIGQFALCLSVDRPSPLK